MAFWAAAAPIMGQLLGKKNDQAPPVESATFNQPANPVDRRMQELQQDPIALIKQGRAALSAMDPDTQKDLNPILDEALKRASMAKGGPNGSGSY